MSGATSPELSGRAVIAGAVCPRHPRGAGRYGTTCVGNPDPDGLAATGWQQTFSQEQAYRFRHLNHTSQPGLTSLRQTFEFKCLHLRNTSKLPSDSVEPRQAEDPAVKQTPAHAPPTVVTTSLLN